MDQIIDRCSLETVWEAIEAHLLDIKRAAVLEVRNYPQPIAGCDAQIPALWEKRDGIAAELDRLSEARRNSTTESRDAAVAFLTDCSFIDDDQKKLFIARASE